MLSRVLLEHIAIIDHLELEFQPGFTVMTGETGAGKSLILDAIEIGLGKRFSPKELLRQGEKRGRIELTFDLSRQRETTCPTLLGILSQLGIELLDGEYDLILSREFTATSSRCRINGSQIPTDSLASLGQLLMEMVGQHAVHDLFSPSRQRDLMDNLGGEPIIALKDQVRASYRAFLSVKAQLADLERQCADRERQLDWLQFQINEITDADIHDIQEDDRLKTERDRLSNRDELQRATYTMQQVINGDPSMDTSSITGTLGQLSRVLNQHRHTEPQFDMWYQEITDCAERINEFHHFLDRYTDRMESDPDRLNQLVERLDTLEKLKRKYGGSLEAVMKTAAQLENQLDQLQQVESSKTHLQEQLAHLQNEVIELSRALTEFRQTLASHLEVSLQQELEALMLPYARFHVSCQTGDIGEHGQDNIEFLFSANPGEPLRKLAQVASGGELARFLLALKIITAHSDGIGTLVLDEADTGISGVTLRVVAEKLTNISQHLQLIVISHQPLVAASAKHHLHLQKAATPEGVTVAARYLMNEQERTAIIGQIASGFTHQDAPTQTFVEGLLASSRQTLL